MRAVPTLLAIAAGSMLVPTGCGSRSARSLERPGADERGAVIAPPTCQVAVNELVFRLALRNEVEARDGLVGECVDNGWSASERRCVMRAGSAGALRECRDVQTTLIIGSREDGVALGIGDCDRVIDHYRRCIPRALPPEIASDTQEALGLTLARWRRAIRDDADDGWRVVQRECNKLIQALREPIRRYGCAR